MSVFSFDDLMKPMTKDEIKKFSLDVLTDLGFPVASWASGAILRTGIAVFAAVAAPFTTLQVEVSRSGFLDFAKGAWKRLQAEQVYDYSPTEATFATGDLTLNNSAGGDYPFAARACRFIYDGVTPAKTYVNVDAFRLHPSETGLVITIEAEEIGSESTAPAGLINRLENNLLGVTCTNDDAVVGFDAESEDSITSQARLSTGILSPNGPAAAYEYVAKSFKLNGGVVITRARAVLDSDTGQSTLYVAGPSGSVPPEDVAKIQDAVNRLCIPLGFDCTVASADELSLDVTANVFIYTTEGFDSSSLETLVTAHLIAYINGVRIGGDVAAPGVGRVFRNSLVAEIKATPTAAGPTVPFYTATVITPSTDFAMLENEVAVPGVITINVNLVSPP
jgi:phage-related baseplate assembly protein